MQSTAQSAIDRTVTGMGYELVDTERSAGGLLRIYIDRIPSAPGVFEFITVEDCERVTRQLQHVLEVENCAYERLEVSSPGLDRPLKKAADYARFAGEQVEVTLKLPFQGRKKYRGQLQPGTAGNESGWRLVLNTDAAAAKGKRKAAAPAAGAAPQQALDFLLEEVREARLVPVLDFKGRRFAPVEPAAGAQAGSDDGNEGAGIQ